jgi:pantoate--beta-alanine ligase
MKMKVINTIEAMSAWSREQKLKGIRIGLVPTMGYLHEGHLSLIKTAKAQSDKVVVSIYINPTQFAPGEDFDQYPRDFEQDEKLCVKEGVDLIFYPGDEIMYPKGFKTYVEVNELSRIMCGLSRPTHFKGVTTVCCKLFNIIQPDISVFGQKDAQQTIILRQMVNDLNIPTELIIAPIVREKDGLALSSRNKYLSESERKVAPILFKSLQFAEEQIQSGNLDIGKIKSEMIKMILGNSSGKIDYIEFRNAHSLEDPNPETNDTLIALAVYFNKSRLIDNIIVPAINNEA